MSEILRVSARGRCGDISDRAVDHSSVHGVSAPGVCWAVDAKVERGEKGLADGSIVRFWGSKEDAEADATRISEGKSFYKDRERRYIDAVVVPAHAYPTQPGQSSRRQASRSTKVESRCDKCFTVHAGECL